MPLTSRFWGYLYKIQSAFCCTWGLYSLYYCVVEFTLGFWQRRKGHQILIWKIHRINWH